MPDQQLIEYISQQLRAGVSEVELQKNLIRSGWQETAVSDAFSSIQSEQPLVIHNAVVSEKKQDKPIIIAIAILVLLLILGVVYAVSQILANQAKINSMQTQDVQVAQVETQDGSLDSAVTNQITVNESVNEDNQSDMLKFAENIQFCTPSQIEFTHFFDGQKYVKEVMGLDGDKCYYTEGMPNNGRMDCYFNTQQTEAIAQYNRQYAESETLSFSSQTSLSPSGTDTQSSESMDGQTVINPWNSALQDGTCVVSGY